MAPGEGRGGHSMPSHAAPGAAPHPHRNARRGGAAAAAAAASAAPLLLLLLLAAPAPSAGQGQISVGSLADALAAAAAPSYPARARAQAALRPRGGAAANAAGGAAGAPADGTVRASSASQSGGGGGWPLQDTLLGGMHIDVVNMTCPTLAEINARTQDLMGATIYSGNIAACIMVSSVESSVISGTNDTCKEPERRGYGEQLPMVFTSKAGVPAPNPLQVMTPVPDKFSAAELEAIMPYEGATYNWVFQGIRNLVEWWPCSKEFNGSLTGYLSPAAASPVPMVPAVVTPVPPEDSPLVLPMASNPGVYTLKELTKNRDKDPQGEGSDKGRDRPKPPKKVFKDYPFFSMFYDAATPGNRLFVILIRGTNTKYEWHVDFEYSRVSNAKFAATAPENEFPGDYFEGETHSGFTKVFNAIWPTIQQALAQHVIPPTRDPSVGVQRVMVAGQSLGGGVGTLVAYAAQKYLNHAWEDTQRSPRPPPVDAIVFGSPNVGNSAFKESMRAIGVNSRRVTFINDVVTQVPCASAPNSRMASMPACPMAIVPTGRDENGQRVYFWDDYQPIGGTVEILPTDLPVQQDAWRVTELHVPVRGDLPHAAHTCAYSCFASKYNLDDTNNRCLLEDPPQPGYSFCRGFPAASAQPARRRAVARLELARP